MRSDELVARGTLRDLAVAMRTQQVSAESLAAQVIENAERLQALNVFTAFDADLLFATARTCDRERAAGRLRGPLHGLPIALKDNIDTLELPTSGGTPALRGNRPPRDAAVWQHLLARGAVLAGKCNLHELCYGGTSDNETFGAVGHPLDALRVPGGSSGGSAVAVAAGLTVAALGSDTAGSVRVPAALCGVVGFRPTSGRYPSAGVMPISPTFDTPGLIARSVDDIALLDELIVPSGSALQPTTDRPNMPTLGVDWTRAAKSSPAVRAAFEQAIDASARLGSSIVELDLAELDQKRKAALAGLTDAEFLPAMRAYLAASAPGLTVEALVEQIASPAVKALAAARIRPGLDATYDFAAALQRRARVRAEFVELFARTRIDAIAQPSAPDIARPRAGDDDVMLEGQRVSSWLYFLYTAFASTLGAPAVTLPAGMAEAFPTGLELVGLPNRDADLLRCARWVAEALRRA
jgi:indoleacetamide hydrolase